MLTKEQEQAFYLAMAKSKPYFDCLHQPFCPENLIESCKDSYEAGLIAQATAEPSEVAQLRADKQYLQRTIDGMNEKHGEVVWQMSEAAKRADAAGRKLGEAVAALKRISKNHRVHQIHHMANEALLSATAQPADDMCNHNNPAARCICREEFGHRVCVQTTEVKS